MRVRGCEEREKITKLDIYASGKHLSLENLDLLSVCCSCNSLCF